MEDFDLWEDSSRVDAPGKIMAGCKELLYPLVILLVAGLCFLPGLGSFGPLDPTDSFFIEAAREMIERNHYLTALYNYTDWLDKPILSFLPIITSIKMFGMTSWAARLPAALSGIGIIVITYIFTASRLGKQTAILAALILSSSPLFLLTGHVALSDEPLSLFFSITMLFAGSALNNKNDKKINIVAYLFLALAVLTKGPIAVVLALISTGLYLIITCPSWTVATQKLRRLRPLAGIMILLTICSPYFYFAHATTNGAFTSQFFLRQNLGRMLGTVNHQEPFWFYLPVFLGGYFPWVLYGLAAIPWLRKIFAIRKQLTARQAWLVFCCCWALTVLILFTVIPTKLPTYIVPLSPALAIVIAAYLTLLIRSQKLGNITLARSIFFSLPAVLAFVMTGISLWFLPIAIKELSTTIGEFSPALGDGRLMLVPLISPDLLEMSCFGTIIVTAALSLLSAWSFWHQQTVKAILSLSLASLLACAVLIPCGLLWTYQTRQVGINNLIHIAKLKNGSLAILFSRAPSTVFFMGIPVPEIQSLSELAEFCRSGAKPHFLLATQNCLNLPELKAEQHVTAQRGKWYLLNVEGYPW